MMAEVCFDGTSLWACFRTMDVLWACFRKIGALWLYAEADVMEMVLSLDKLDNTDNLEDGRLKQCPT